MTTKENLKNFLDKDGKLKQIPSRRKLQVYFLFYLAEQFQPNRIYTEKEVNQLINERTAFIDPCTFRRDMVECKFLSRKDDCTQYKMVLPQPTMSDLGFCE